ncbi:MAG: glycosyltransferase family 1 protein [Phascolarctobacterium sp.]|nr:glycosyltransferase family 1 protein [Phascolarctobacterium sp.]
MEKPIRVLQIMGIVESGGVEAVIRNYYRNIDKSKVQFDFVMHRGGNPDYIADVKSMGARIYEITPYSKNIFAFTYEIYNIVKNGHYDIVHSNMNSLSGFPLFAAWLAGARVRILHNHTTDTKAEGLRTYIKRILRPFARMFANQYWACSKLAGAWMYGKDAVESGKVTIINNAIDLSKFAFNQVTRDRLRNELDLEGKFVLGHVGRFMKQKNHDFLIDIFAEVLKQKPEAVLLLVGEGPLKKEIEYKVARLGISEKVKFLGVRSDVADLYNAMDAFVLPSFYEGLPVVGVEVQANGLPFICSDQVTKEIMISENISLIPLSIGDKYWANIVVLSSRTNIDVARVSLRQAGYNILYEAERLEKLYTKC